LDYVDLYDRAESTYYNNGKHFYIDGIGPVVEKYEAFPSRDAEERVAEYTKELAEQSRDRAWTGAEMLTWQLSEIDLQAKQVAERKKAHLESVEVKLAEEGWDPIDFPALLYPEFRDLVYKDQQLTPKSMWH
ncbi:hypothetical protein FRC01_011672, partial [Tulasnella sp. 417]